MILSTFSREVMETKRKISDELSKDKKIKEKVVKNFNQHQRKNEDKVGKPNFHHDLTARLKNMRKRK